MRAALEPGVAQVVTDPLRSYPAAKAEIPEPGGVRHVFVKAGGFARLVSPDGAMETLRGDTWLPVA